MRRYPDIPSIRTLAVSCCLVFHAVICMGQEPAVYNINKYNGLSSNHVYCTLVDRLGYLWLGTTDGVYRYNGYSLKKYNYTDGLPNVDVWNLYEDKQGRIWLKSIAQHIGYIKNNKYHRVYKKTKDPNFEIYPGDFTEANDTIVFSNVTLDNKGNFQVCFIKNDTFYLSHIVSKKDSQHMVPVYIGSYVYHSSDSSLLQYSLAELLSNKKHGQPVNIVRSNFNYINALTNEAQIRAYVYKYQIFYQPLGTLLHWVDLQSGYVSTYSVPDILSNKHERSVFCFISGNYLNCITSNNILIFDSNATLKYRYALDSLYQNPDISGFTSTFFSKDNFWGNVLSTKNNGCYLQYNSSQSFKRCNTDLLNYTYLNNKNDTEGYWWNSNERILAVVRDAQIIKKIPLPDFYNVKRVVDFDSSRSLISNQFVTSWLYADYTTSPVANSEYTIRNTKNIGAYEDLLKIGALGLSNDIVVTDTKEVYIMGTSFLGVYKFRINETNKTITIDHINEQRFTKVVFNKATNTIICYSSGKVLLLNRSNKSHILLNQLQLEALGINAIEKIMADKYGNIYVKDYNNLKLVDIRRGTIKTLLVSYSLEKAVVEIIDDYLFVAGNFGVLKAAIYPDGNIRITNAFQNTKNLYYKYINDVQFSTNHAFLKTDNGFFTYSYPSPTQVNLSDPFKIVANYNDSLYALSYNDTLIITQDAPVINLDVIKPTGTGKLHIDYSLNKSTSQFTENQLILPNLKPGSYNTVSLIASDDSWRSEPLKFTIYIQPKWWQKQTAKRVIFVLSMLAFIGFVYLVIVMTRRMVNRSNERRNQRRELELKSIYSQINPHFIFNSLSTAQYFVKKNKNKEAFEHINQFSDLLRAYIKSSRAKYITIAEEIDNLENYLQLQLTRFEEKFDYNITIDTSVNPQKVKIPSLLLQPLVENALNHGIFHSETKGNLHISFKVDEQDKDTLVCIVDDNGVGRQKSKELRGKIIRKADSYGTILIKELIDTFNKYEKINIEIEYIDKQLPLTGTTVVIRIKNFTHAQ